MRLDKNSPLIPTPYEKKDVAAIQALLEGNASEAQQKHALSYIINNMCGTYDEPFRPDQRETDYALGKAHIGRDLVKLTKLNMGNMK